MNLEYVGVLVASALGSAFAVWGVVRAEVTTLRDRLQAFESRLATLEGLDRAETRIAHLEDLVQRVITKRP